MNEYLFQTFMSDGVSMAKQWAAIHQRRSTTQFTNRSIDQEAERILQFLDNCPLPFASHDLHIDWVDAQTLEDLLMKDMKRVIPAPQYLIFSSYEEKAQHFNLGFLLQALGLWLHVHGLGMRIQSHFRAPDPDQGQASDYEPHIGHKRKQELELMPILAAIGEPLSYGTRPKRSLVLKPSYFIDHQLPASRLVRSLLHIAITAPSDGHQNPWLFMVDQNTVSFFVRTKYRLRRQEKAMIARASMGGLLCNFLLAAKLRNIETKMYQAQDMKGIGAFSYVGTIRLEAKFE